MNLLGLTDHRPLVALAPVIGLAAYCVSHVITARIIRGRSPYPALAIGVLVGLAVTIAITLVACRRDAVSLVDTLGEELRAAAAAFPLLSYALRLPTPSAPTSTSYATPPTTGSQPSSTVRGPTSSASPSGPCPSAMA